MKIQKGVNIDSIKVEPVAFIELKDMDGLGRLVRLDSIEFMTELSDKSIRVFYKDQRICDYLTPYEQIANLFRPLIYIKEEG